MNRIGGLTTQDVEITVLVDNRADMMAKSTDTVKRFTEEPLLAEHGFAALIDLEEAGQRILWGGGITRIALLENARCIKIDLTTIDKIALSHGHQDHFAALTDVIREIARRPASREWDKDATLEEMRSWAEGRRRVPLIAHPAAFRERWAIIGGFHLGPAKDEEIRRTIEEIKQMKPAMVVPSHCTGFEATRQFANQMPDQFVLGTVGTKYLF